MLDRRHTTLTKQERVARKRVIERARLDPDNPVASFLQIGAYKRSPGHAVELLQFKRDMAIYLLDPALQLHWLQGRKVDEALHTLGFPIGPEYVNSTRGRGSPVFVGNLTGKNAKQLASRELVLEDNCLLPRDPTDDEMKEMKATKPKTTIPDSREPLARGQAAALVSNP